MDKILRLKLIKLLKDNFSEWQLDLMFEQSNGTLSEILESEEFKDQ